MNTVEEPELPAYRTKLRTKGQLTLPPEIRDALRVKEGDELEFTVGEGGEVTVRGYMLIPTDQAWFFTPEWLAGEREADEEIARGGGRIFMSDEEFLAHLEELAEHPDGDAEGS